MSRRESDGISNPLFRPLGGRREGIKRVAWGEESSEILDFPGMMKILEAAPSELGVRKVKDGFSFSGALYPGEHSRIRSFGIYRDQRGDHRISVDGEMVHPTSDLIGKVSNIIKSIGNKTEELNKISPAVEVPEAAAVRSAGRRKATMIPTKSSRIVETYLPIGKLVKVLQAVKPEDYARLGMSKSRDGFFNFIGISNSRDVTDNFRVHETDYRIIQNGRDAQNSHSLSQAVMEIANKAANLSRASEERATVEVGREQVVAERAATQARQRQQDELRKAEEARASAIERAAAQARTDAKIRQAKEAARRAQEEMALQRAAVERMAAEAAQRQELERKQQERAKTERLAVVKMRAFIKKALARRAQREAKVAARVRAEQQAAQELATKQREQAEAEARIQREAQAKELAVRQREQEEAEVRMREVQAKVAEDQRKTEAATLIQSVARRRQAGNLVDRLREEQQAAAKKEAEAKRAAEVAERAARARVEANEKAVREAQAAKEAAKQSAITIFGKLNEIPQDNREIAGVKSIRKDENIEGFTFKAGRGSSQDNYAIFSDGAIFKGSQQIHIIPTAALQAVDEITKAAELLRTGQIREAQVTEQRAKEAADRARQEEAQRQAAAKQQEDAKKLEAARKAEREQAEVRAVAERVQAEQQAAQAAATARQREQAEREAAVKVVELDKAHIARMEEIKGLGDRIDIFDEIEADVSRVVDILERGGAAVDSDAADLNSVILQSNEVEEDLLGGSDFLDELLRDNNIPNNPTSAETSAVSANGSLHDISTEEETKESVAVDVTPATTSATMPSQNGEVEDDIDASSLFAQEDDHAFDHHFPRWSEAEAFKAFKEKLFNPNGTIKNGEDIGKLLESIEVKEQVKKDPAFAVFCSALDNCKSESYTSIALVKGCAEFLGDSEITNDEALISVNGVVSEMKKRGYKNLDSQPDPYDPNKKKVEPPKEEEKSQGIEFNKMQVARGAVAAVLAIAGGPFGPILAIAWLLMSRGMGKTSGKSEEELREEFEKMREDFVKNMDVAGYKMDDNLQKAMMQASGASLGAQQLAAAATPPGINLTGAAAGTATAQGAAVATGIPGSAASVVQAGTATTVNPQVSPSSGVTTTPNQVSPVGVSTPTTVDSVGGSAIDTSATNPSVAVAGSGRVVDGQHVDVATNLTVNHLTGRNRTLPEIPKSNPILNDAGLRSRLDRVVSGATKDDMNIGNRSTNRLVRSTPIRTPSREI